MVDLTTGEAAKALAVSQQHVRGLLRDGILTGRQLADGTWLVDPRSITSFQLVRVGRGRNWSPEASWALLGELSSQLIVEVPLRTWARVRVRIRTYAAEDIARNVATRNRAHRFSADSWKATASGLVLTGRSATEAINSNLSGRSRVVEGYLRDGVELGDFVHRHLLIPDHNGDVIIHSRPANVRFDGRHAPAAVIAADLARSTNTRERSAGIIAIEGMRQQWIARD